MLTRRPCQFEASSFAGDSCSCYKLMSPFWRAPSSAEDVRFCCSVTSADWRSRCRTQVYPASSLLTQQRAPPRDPADEYSPSCRPSIEVNRNRALRPSTSFAPVALQQRLRSTRCRVDFDILHSKRTLFTLRKASQQQLFFLPNA